MPAPTPTRGPDLLTPLLSHLATTSPLQAGVLTTTVRDLALAVEWVELRPTVLPGTDWVAVIGRKRKSDPLRAVLPLPLNTTSLTPQQLSIIFRSLSLIDAEWLPEALPPLAPSLEELRALKAQRALERGDEQSVTEETKVNTEIEANAASPAAEASKTETTEASPEIESHPETESLAAEEAESTEFDPDTLYVAIGTTDSTVVYYKLSRGIKKPADIPDE